VKIEETTKRIEQLERSWCDERNIVVLKTYFEGFTDERYTGFLNALKATRSLRGDLFTEEEIEATDFLISGMQEVLDDVAIKYPQKVTREILNQTRELIDGWCVSYNTSALASILRGWPVAQVLDTSDWERLFYALKMVRGFGTDSLTPDELHQLNV
jgi:hypothetical protein